MLVLDPQPPKSIVNARIVHHLWLSGSEHEVGHEGMKAIKTTKAKKGRKLTSLEMSTICRAMKMAAIRSSLYDEWLDAGMAIDWHDFAVNMLLVRLKRGEYRRFGLKL